MSYNIHAPLSIFLVMSSNLKLIISGPHIDGLSALYTHEKLGLEMVMDAFVRYMAFVKDKIHPSKAYVDTTWLTESA